MYKNNIIDKNEELNSDGIKKLLTYLINKNPDIIKRTALKNCHAVGLNSFILNYDPKIRLFISDEDCEIRTINNKNPIIPIHPHKYDDLFVLLGDGDNLHKKQHKSPLFSGDLCIRTYLFFNNN